MGVAKGGASPRRSSGFSEMWRCLTWFWISEVFFGFYIVEKEISGICAKKLHLFRYAALTGSSWRGLVAGLGSIPTSFRCQCIGLHEHTQENWRTGNSLTPQPFAASVADPPAPSSPGTATAAAGVPRRAAAQLALWALWVVQSPSWSPWARWARWAPVRGWSPGAHPDWWNSKFPPSPHVRCLKCWWSFSKFWKKGADTWDACFKKTNKEIPDLQHTRGAKWNTCCCGWISTDRKKNRSLYASCVFLCFLLPIINNQKKRPLPNPRLLNIHHPLQHRLLCSFHPKRWRNSNKALLRWSSFSMPMDNKSSGCRTTCGSWSQLEVSWVFFALQTSLFIDMGGLWQESDFWVDFLQILVLVIFVSWKAWG